MNKATVFTTDGAEVECEYNWIDENYTTITFYSSESCYTKFSKFNVIMWMINELKEQKNE